MRRASVIVAAIAFIAAVPMNTLANAIPSIGGTPIHTEADYFVAGEWGVTVYSYVYDFSSSSLPDMGITLFPDEMLFVYLLDGDDTKTASIEYFSVENPEEYGLGIDTIGYEDTIIPSGYSGDDYQEPTHYEYSGFTHTTSYYYIVGPFAKLAPDEWSLVFYVAVCDTWGPATGTISGVGADEHDIPAPVPEPTTICLLGLGALALLRKRRA